MLNKCYYIVFLLGSLASTAKAQAPCNTNFTGYDPCSAEWLQVGVDCASSQEVFRTNGCSGLNPTGSSCGLASGAHIVWGKFTVATADNVTIEWTSSNNRNIRLGLYQYSDPCDMDFDFDYGETEIACVNGGGAGVDETLTQYLTAGTYYVVGKSSGNLSAATQICVHSPSATPPITASDCSDAVDICTDANFQVDPNGTGSSAEIPASGGVGNPYYDGFSAPFMPWSSTNMGCLQTDENNSTWMVVNVLTGGDLEFTFGGNGTQAGFYDWIMYDYDASACTDIPTDTKAPIRCNWNGVDYGGTGLANILPVGGDATNYEPEVSVLSGERYIICFSNYSSVSTSVPLEFRGSADVSCTPLPIELSDFTATMLGDEGIPQVKLQWGTLIEESIDRFYIERSTNGVDFMEIGEVESRSSGIGLTNYSYIDQFPNMGGNYYRLKQKNLDGKTEYSEIAYVKFESEDFIKFYPNPFGSQLNLKYYSTNDESITIEVSDITGRGYSFDYQVIQGENVIGLTDFGDFSKGCYVINVRSESSEYVGYLVKNQ